MLHGSRGVDREIGAGAIKPDEIRVAFIMCGEIVYIHVRQRNQLIVFFIMMVLVMDFLEHLIPVHWFVTVLIMNITQFF